MTSSIPPQGKHLPPAPASVRFVLQVQLPATESFPADYRTGGSDRPLFAVSWRSFLLFSPWMHIQVDHNPMVPTATLITESARQVLPSCSRNIYSFLFPASFLILACHGSASNIPCIQLWITAQHLFSIISSLSTYYLSVLTFSSTCHRTSSGTMSSHATSQAPPPQ
jgi:hypothetical protein